MSETLVQRGTLELLSLGELLALGADVVVTTRRGGVSSPPYDTLNLGDHVGDDPAAVAENRRLLATAMGVEPDRLVIARQVHGTTAKNVRVGVGPGVADVLVTTDPGVAICVLVADCVPLVVLDPVARVLAVAHAGWRGTVAGVAAAAIRAAEDFGAKPHRCVAALGPSISRRAYQVGPEVAEALSAAGGAHALEPDGADHFRADLPAANVAQLVAAGVDPTRVTRSELATDGGVDFFSDRAQRPCGRFALAARLVATSS